MCCICDCSSVFGKLAAVDAADNVVNRCDGRSLSALVSSVWCSDESAFFALGVVVLSRCFDIKLNCADDISDINASGGLACGGVSGSVDASVRTATFGA